MRRRKRSLPITHLTTLSHPKPLYCRIYDVYKQVEIATLSHQIGTITCMDFYQQTNFLSGAADGSICIWDATTWDLLKTLKGHT